MPPLLFLKHQQMKSISKFILLIIFTVIASRGYSNNANNKISTTPKNNDTTITTKSNIVIFKMLPSPTYTNSNSGSLKKGGKVARTSTSRY